jgi:hypothetical protein
MSLDIGLDKYGKGHGKYVTWGYLPHEDKYHTPTIEGRNAAVVMKRGVYDGRTDTYKLMDQSFTREDTEHAWYDEAGPVHPFDRTTKPIAKNDVDRAGKYSWATAVGHNDNGRLEAGPLARQLVADGTHGESWQHHNPLVLRHFAHMHEGVKIYRQIEHVFRELRLADEWYIKPSENDGRGWGAMEAIRGALCHWIEVQGGKIKNYQIFAPTTWSVGPRASSGEPRGASKLVIVDACRSGAELHAARLPLGPRPLCRPAHLKAAFPTEVTVFLVEAADLGFGLALFGPRHPRGHDRHAADHDLDLDLCRLRANCLRNLPDDRAAPELGSKPSGFGLTEPVAPSPSTCSDLAAKPSPRRMNHSWWRIPAITG